MRRSTRERAARRRGAPDDRGSRPARWPVRERTRWSIAPGRSAIARTVVAEREAFDGVRAQAEAQRLEREHVIRRDVAEVALCAEARQQPHLLRAQRRLEDEPIGIDSVHDLVDQPGTRLAVG